MEQHPNDLTRDDEIDSALEHATQLGSELRILEATYHPESSLEFLMLRLSNGHRLLIPREDLSELKTASAEQASHLVIGPNGVDLWWPDLDDGLYLPDFLRYRWQQQSNPIAA